MPDPLVRIHHLGVKFEGRDVLHDVNFEVDEGESVAVIGPNGSGKTVLLKSLLGLIPFTGAVEWKPNTRIGYVPQKIDADRSLPLNGRNVLHSKARVIGCTPEQVHEAIVKVGLSDELLSRHIGQLSGGEFQRTLIAFALLGDPQIVILDEPTASLDEPGEEQIFELIHRLQHEVGIATITVSHDVSFVYRYASRVLCLNRSGNCYGPTRGILTADTLNALYGTRAFFQHAPHA